MHTTGRLVETDNKCSWDFITSISSIVWMTFIEVTFYLHLLREILGYILQH